MKARAALLYTNQAGLGTGLALLRLYRLHKFGFQSGLASIWIPIWISVNLVSNLDSLDSVKQGF